MRKILWLFKVESLLYLDCVFTLPLLNIFWVLSTLNSKAMSFKRQVQLDFMRILFCFKIIWWPFWVYVEDCVLLFGFGCPSGRDDTSKKRYQLKWSWSWYHMIFVFFFNWIEKVLMICLVSEGVLASGHKLMNGIFWGNWCNTILF